MWFKGKGEGKNVMQIPNYVVILSMFFKAYAAGFLEGHVTSRVLYLYWLNTVDGYCQGKEKICAEVVKFVHQNTEWVRKMVTK